MLADFERMQREFEHAGAEFVRVELELAATFLDLAAVTASFEHFQKCVRDAEVAVRTADRVLESLRFPEKGSAAIRERRQQLRDRLRDFSRMQKKTEIARLEAHWPGIRPPG